MNIMLTCKLSTDVSLHQTCVPHFYRWLSEL